MIMSEKEEFITLHKKKGYIVEDYGEMVILTLDNLYGIHYFLKNGNHDKRIDPFWCLARQK